jgi:hypothetical protein
VLPPLFQNTKGVFMKQKVKVTLTGNFTRQARKSELLERNIIREPGLRKLYLLPENDPGDEPTLAQRAV